MDEQRQRLVFLPSTFEGMMECFGVNLQRMTLFQKFKEEVEEIYKITKSKEIPPQAIDVSIDTICDLMGKILSISIADSSNLQNQHNKVFLSLIEHFRRQREEETQRIKKLSSMRMY